MSNLFPHFPVFLDLAGRAVMVLGDEPDLCAIAQSCISAGASVTVFAPEPSADVLGLAPSVRLRARRWRAADFKGASLVVASASEPRIAKARTAAHAVDALFHARGAPDVSDIAFGNVGLRGGLAFGVSAPNAPQPLVGAVRDHLAAALPIALAEFLAAATTLQDAVAQKLGDPDECDRFWARLVAEAFEQNLTGEERWRGFILERLDAL